MTLSGDYILIALILLALGLTIISFRVGLLLFRLAPAIAWLGLGILFWTGGFGISLGDPWVQAISLVFLVMAIAVLTLQIRADVRHEASIRNPQGFPGSRTESWTTWGPKGKKKRLTAKERQRDYKDRLASRRR